MSVVELDDYRPHTSGPCHCAQCGYEWIGVILSGQTAITCPECNSGKGMRSGFVFPNDVATLRCQDCEGEVSNDLFTIMANGQMMCAHCGAVRDWPPE